MRGYQDLRSNLDVWRSRVAARSGQLATRAWNYGKAEDPTPGEARAASKLYDIMSSPSLKDERVHFNVMINTPRAQRQAREENARLQRRGVITSQVDTGVDDDSALRYETRAYTELADDGRRANRFTVTIWDNGNAHEGTTVAWERFEDDGKTVRDQAIAQVGPGGTVFGDGGTIGSRDISPIDVLNTFGSLVSR